MAADETETERRRAALAKIEGRSPLHDWMRAHRADLEAQFAAVGRPRWASVAKVLAELGVKDARGQPPNPQTVRQAWIKVRASAPVAAPVHGASGMSSGSSPSHPPASAPPTQPAPPNRPPVDRSPVDLTAGVNTPPRPKFGFARLR